MAQAVGPEKASLKDQIRTYLVCPLCRRSLELRDSQLRCQACDFEGAVRDGIVVMGKAPAASFFDDKFEAMREGHLEGRGDWEFAYRQQVAFLARYLEASSVILDVGCGPSICYRKPTSGFLVGLEYSFPSIRSNRDVDMGICGSAASIPFADGALDLAVCFYSLHHMVGGSIRESSAILSKVFSELGRVVKPGGHLVVFEMRPDWPYRAVQRLAWDVARKLLAERLDMHMWPQPTVEALGSTWIAGARFEVHTFASPRLLMFPPVFAMPWLRIPRMLYPLSPVAYVWSKS